MAKTKEYLPDRRSPGPKNKRTVIPSSFQISRPVSPMRQILEEAEGRPSRPSIESIPSRPSTPSTNSLTVTDVELFNNNSTDRETAPTRGSRESTAKNQTTTISTESRPSTVSLVRTSPYPGIAPSRDFMRVANSITREAVPGGLFAGKAKQLYDYLYSKTRGAVVPKMSVRLTKRELMKGADINTEVTLRSNLNRLRTIGLLETIEMRGVHGGNEYTVYIPDEVVPQTDTRPSRDARLSISSQKIETVESLENRGSRGGVNLDTEGGLTAAKTLLNTTTDDDDRTGLQDFLKEIEIVAAEMIGGPLPSSEQERDRWIECGKTLAEELRKIGTRTSTISSVPALLNAHLKRSFGRQQQPQTAVKERLPEIADPKERLKKIIRETRGLHVGDPGYQREDLIADVRYRAERVGLNATDALIEEMIGPESED